MSNQAAGGKAFWSCAGFTVFSAFVSATFSMLALGMVGTGHQHEYALYAASRSIALLIAAAFALGLRSLQGVVVMTVAMALVQMLDTVVGILIHNPGQTYGPLLFTVIHVALLIWMNRSTPQAKA
jgi:hypothetical protein